MNILQLVNTLFIFFSYSVKFPNVKVADRSSATCYDLRTVWSID